MTPRRFLAALLAASILAPLVLAAESEPRYADAEPFPEDYVRIARRSLDAAKAEYEPVKDEPWAASAQASLEAAERYLADGRVRSASLAIASARTALAFHPLWEDVDAAGSESAKRARALAGADALLAAAERSERAFRAKLHALDGNLTSLAALEAALYAGDRAMDAEASLAAYPTFRKEAVDGEFYAGLVLALVYSTVGAETAFEQATDLIDAAAAREGVVPRFDAKLWTNLTIVARISVPEGGSPPTTKAYDDVARSTAGTGEDLLAVSAFFAAMRAQQVAGVQTMFGDGAARGTPAISDLWSNLNRSAEASHLKPWRDAGYHGILAVDGADHARYVVAEDDISIASLARAWIAMEFPPVAFSRVFANLAPDYDPAAFTSGEEPAAGSGRLVPLVAGVAVVGVAAALIGLGRRKR